MGILHYPGMARPGEVRRIPPSAPRVQTSGTRSKIEKALLGVGVALVAIPAITAWNSRAEHAAVKERAEQAVTRLRADTSSQISMMDLTQAIEPFARSFHHNKWQKADSLLLQQVMVHTLMREIGRDIHANLGADIPLSEDPHELLSHWEETIGGEERMSPQQKRLKDNLLKSAAAAKDLQEGQHLQKTISSDASQFVQRVWLTEDDLANRLPPLPHSHGEQPKEATIARRDLP